MLRDLFMAALGAASGLGVLVVITVALKLRENAERHRRGVTMTIGEFYGDRLPGELSRDEYIREREFD